MNEINLWLDDTRQPPLPMHSGRMWLWAKTADEAIEILKSGNVTFASLDHDLALEHYVVYENEQQYMNDHRTFKEKTGYSVICWMEENNIWPKEGVRVHTMNPVGKDKMLEIVNKIYGRTFQSQYLGTHIV